MCERCSGSRGDFSNCSVVIKEEGDAGTHRDAICLNGSYANCHMDGTQCSFRNDDSRYGKHAHWKPHRPTDPLKSPALSRKLNDPDLADDYQKAKLEESSTGADTIRGQASIALVQYTQA